MLLIWKEIAANYAQVAVTSQTRCYSINGYKCKPANDALIVFWELHWTIAEKVLTRLSLIVKVLNLKLKSINTHTMLLIMLNYTQLIHIFNAQAYTIFNLPSIVTVTRSESTEMIWHFEIWCVYRYYCVGLSKCTFETNEMWANEWMRNC